MATKKLQILDYSIKQAENANTVGGYAPEHFATAADVTAMQNAMADVQEKVGDTSVSDQVRSSIAYTDTKISEIISRVPFQFVLNDDGGVGMFYDDGN